MGMQINHQSQTMIQVQVIYHHGKQIDCIVM